MFVYIVKYLYKHKHAQSHGHLEPKTIDGSNFDVIVANSLHAKSYKV